MNVTVWGCRGSLPSPGPEKNKYGGNTSCLQITHNDTCIVLDGGSGIQRLGAHLKGGMKELHILLTHLHIDHTMGLGFFLPLYDPEVTVHIWGPASAGSEPLIQRLRRYFSPPLFPLRLDELPRHPVIHEIHDSEFQIGDVHIKSAYICHPGPTLGFRLTCGSSVMAYMPDHEPALGSSRFPYEPEWTSGYEIAHHADLLFHDGQFNAVEYQGKIGWGHCSTQDAIAFAELCKVKKLALFHHDPLRTDVEIDQLLRDSLKLDSMGTFVEMCAEGNVYSL